jgi:hypothetical protein
MMKSPWDGVSERILAPFASQYITLTSIIESVALAYLVSAFESQSNHVRPETWALSSTTFVVIVLLWNEFRIGASTFLWQARISDALISFVFGAVQLIMIWSLKNVGEYRHIWFTGLPITFVIGLGAYVNVDIMTRKYAGLNPESLRKEYLLSGYPLCAFGCLTTGVVAIGVARTWIHPITGGFINLAVAMVFVAVREWTWTRMLRAVNKAANGPASAGSSS